MGSDLNPQRPQNGMLGRMQRAMRIVSWGRTAQGAVPPGLADPIRFPYGPFQFKIENPGLKPYTIFCSTDLVNWEEVARSRPKLASGEEYVDSAAPNFGHRFYRVATEGLPPSNVIGYCAVILSPGFTLIVNPFHNGNCEMAEAFKGWPDGTSVSKFDGRLMRVTENILKDAEWTIPGQQLAPGEGAIFFNPTSDYKRHSFVGDVAEGSFNLPIASGFSLHSSMVPGSGKLDDDLKFPISNGDVVHIFDGDRQAYVTHPFEQGKWT